MSNIEDTPGLSDGHRRCLSAIRPILEEITASPTELVFVLAEESEEGVSGVVMREQDACALIASEPRLVEPIRQARLAACSFEIAAVVILMDRRGTYLVFCAPSAARPVPAAAVGTPPVSRRPPLTVERVLRLQELSAREDTAGLTEPVARKMRADPAWAELFVRDMEAVVRHLERTPEGLAALRSGDRKVIDAAIRQLRRD